MLAVLEEVLGELDYRKLIDRVCAVISKAEKGE